MPGAVTLERCCAECGKRTVWYHAYIGGDLVRRFHYSTSVAWSLCARGSGRPWFRAGVTNHNHAATYVRCNVDGFRGDHLVTRRVQLPVGVVQFPAGMYLNRGQTRTLEW
jgi:hypothetical protein